MKKISFKKWARFTSLSAFISLSCLSQEGYWVTKDGQIWRNASGECWKTKDWTSAMAIAECDPELGKAKQAEVTPIEEVPAASLNTDFGSPARFELNEAQIRAKDQARLRSVAEEVKTAGAEKTIVIEGHADRTGHPEINERLSEERAQEAKGYLVSQGIPENQIQVEAKGSTEPLTDETACEGKTGSALASCLEVDRRVDVFLR